MLCAIIYLNSAAWIWLRFNPGVISWNLIILSIKDLGNIILHRIHLTIIDEPFYFSLIQTWYNIQSRILNSLSSGSDSTIESFLIIISIISFILVSISAQICISEFYIFSKTQFINSILFFRSLLYVLSSCVHPIHHLESWISLCNVCSTVIIWIRILRI